MLKIKTCPICKVNGELVSNVTVESLSKIESIEVNQDHYLCLNPTCDVVYFTANKNLIMKSDVKVPIWYKKDADPQYICYCSKVEKPEIVDAIVNKGCKTVSEIVKNTNAMNNSDCIHKSPTGKCCSRQIKDLINEYN
jgi:bacterioferritin-associated ferredoxin